ncbi:MAG TPA: ATP-binding protein [Thermoanaerobaculia bacterium]|nr:ATP-binding protein [Thermoanaerobaculia bacterium]
MTPALFLLLSLAASPSTSSPAVAKRAAELRRGWEDLDARAHVFLNAPSVASSMRGGGVAVDRGALFAAAAAALSGGHRGFSLTLLDPTGDPIAWAGRAPTFFPTGDPSGAIWSAESVVFFRTLSFSFPPENRAGTLVEAWRVLRSSPGVRLAPDGRIPWNATGVAVWGGVDPAPLDPASQRRRIAERIFVGGAFVLLVLSLLVPARPRRGGGPGGAGVRPAIRASVALSWGTAGVAALVSPALKLEPGDYLREGAVIAGFAFSAAAAALFACSTGRARSLVLPAFLAIGGFLAGTLSPSPVGVAVAFAAALAAILAGGPAAAPARVFAAAALASTALFGPLVLFRQERAIANRAAEVSAAVRAGRSPSRAAARAAAAVPAEIARTAGGFRGARQQDLTDLAFAIWKSTGLAAEAPVSGIRLWREGRLVSRFSSGTGIESEATASVGGETVPVERRRIPVAPRPEFAPGEAPLEAEIETADWPSWRPLPEPLRAYHDLLLGLEAPPPAEPPRTSERFLESLTAATAALIAIIALAALGAAILLISGGRRVHLRPLTFRGRITALFTALVIVPFLAATIYIRHTLATRLRRETLAHAQTALETARTVLDDYLFAAGTSPGRRQLIDDDLLAWMGKIVGHDLSIYADGRLFSTSRRELFASGLLPERIDGDTLGKILAAPAGFVVESRRVMHRPFDQVEAALASIPGRLAFTGPAVLSIPLLPEQRETEEEIARLSASLMLFTLAVFGVSLLLGARTAFRVTGPIGDLVEGTRAVARGETPAVPLPADAELKNLVEAFLSMAATLDQQRDDLARAQRLRAWAEMARIIAHEIKNPLTPIRLSAEHLREVWRRGDPTRDQVLEECVANILRQTESLRGIAAEFSDYARLPEPHRESVPMRPLVEGVVSAYSASPGISWEIDVPGVEAVADPRLIARALTNLVANAREALGEDGGRIAVRLVPRDGRWVFRVEDDGPGVSREDMGKLFEPYFSSKSGGSGLGLAIVRKIAEEHGGTARAFRLSPRGFAVEFDFADSAAAADDPVGGPRVASRES